MALPKARPSTQATPKPVFVLLALSALGCVLLVGLQLPLIWGDRLVGRPVTAVITGFVALGLLACTVMLYPKKPGQASAETRAWRLIVAGVAVVALIAIAAEGLDVLTGRGSRHPSGAGDLAFSLGCIAACGLIYQGLLHWNRLRIGRSDPGETLNGISAFLVTAGGSDLLLDRLPQVRSGLTVWQLQASVGTGAAVIVVLGAAITILLIGGLLNDVRIWLIISAMLSVGVGDLVALLVNDNAARPLARTLWLLGMVVLVLCALTKPGRARADTTTDQAIVIGAMVVLFAGLAVLVVNDEFAMHRHGSHLATLFAAAGVFAASLRMLRLVEDLSHLAQSRHEAATDELTGVANRRALLSAMDTALVTARSASLLIVDLDHFKAINDRYGHPAGDSLLQHVAKAFGASVPDGALLARLGGDEFAVLLKDADAGQAIALAQTLTHAAPPLDDIKGVLQVGVSVGVATISAPGTGGGELLRRADTALDQAKILGSGVREYDEALDAATQEQLSLVEDLHLALRGETGREEEIIVYFQPQLKAATGAVVGAEALVRWAHPRLGILSPDKFVDLAEDNGLMPSLTARVMRVATAQAAVWRAAGHHLRISVNLSATCLSDPTLLPLINEVLSRGLRAEDLVLEVTETSLMTNPAQSLAAMKRLAERGVGVSIDDYGTGYSSLSYLNDLPATELKIDRSFTARTVGEPRTAAIVGGTVELAHRLGIRIVAEGVEDEETLDAMRSLGCDETQGYLHSRPLPASVFLEWLNARPGTTTSPPQPAVTLAGRE